jgi:hypothetical protein
MILHIYLIGCLIATIMALTYSIRKFKNGIDFSLLNLIERVLFILFWWFMIIWLIGSFISELLSIDEIYYAALKLDKIILVKGKK